MSSSFITELKAAIAPEMARLFQTRFIRALLGDDRMPLDLWKVYLWESYHYVKHNGINQAIAVMGTEVTRKKLMIRYLKHALEEIDHDSMCLRDLEKVGVPRERVIASKPLPETAAFSSLLYDWTLRENPAGRLGYSFWAEGTNEHAGLMIGRLRYHFELPDDHMTFVVSHADLDTGHAEECEHTIDELATTQDDREAILYFGPASCRMFSYVLEAMFDRFERERGTL